ncbi:hypothetical protein GCM10010503_64340 [Streptomyces lucensis JCM 4490]|uniref:Uncharacterized protein n=1 Tax=Streptomyces lucensis JCM 4490 TaxID=1306176 RepID=A0A918JF36_9ACTN|nr:hypothetical protein GCM10010503_64340 [Streptomyces lucensis JCM 4490]
MPVVLTLAPGGVSARGRDGEVVFQGDPREVEGRLTRLGTLVVRVAGKRYALVGRGGDLSPAPSAGQVAAVEPFATASGAGGGAVDQLLNGGAAGRMREWRDRFAAVGARLG